MPVEVGYRRVRVTELFGKVYWWGIPEGATGPWTLFPAPKPKTRIVDVFSNLLNDRSA